MNYTNLPEFSLDDCSLNTVEKKSKYLGHVMCIDMSDGSDIEQQTRELYAQGNSILRKFNVCNWSKANSVQILLLSNIHIPIMVELQDVHNKQTERSLP